MVRTQPLAVRLQWQLRQNGEKGQMTAKEKARVAEAAENKEHVNTVAKELDRSWATVDKWMKNWTNTGSFDSPTRKNSGRPKTATAPAVVAAVVAEMTAPGDDQYVPSAAAVKRKLKLPYSVRSVTNAAKRGGLVCIAKSERPFLSKADRVRRMRWARKMRRDGINWRRVVCSDEKQFVLEDKQRRCWMKPGAPRYRNTRQHPKSVMVWGGISLMGSTRLVFIEGKIDSTMYQGVLKSALLPLARAINSSSAEQWWFQQDNARPHTSIATTTWFAAHPAIPRPIPWQPYSPDASPIENLWGIMQQDVNASNPHSIPELKGAIRKAWTARTGNVARMEALLGSWGDRVKDLATTGGETLHI